METEITLFNSIYSEDLFLIPAPTTIILDQSWDTLAIEEKGLLEKILSAIKQSLDSVTLIYQATLNLAALTEKPKKAIYFGKAISGIPLYEPIEAAGVSLVASGNLTALSQDEEARKKLWQSLRKQFSV